MTSPLHPGPKIGTLDIETAPLQGHVWGLFDQNVGLAQIAQEWSILSFCFKPLHGKRADVVYEDVSEKENFRDDYDLCLKLWNILNEYDIIIAQNGKRFDLKKIKARMVMHGLKPPSPVRVIDTLLMARQVFSFTSNKLEWLAKHLTAGTKSKHKKFPGMELWLGCMSGNPEAWAEMKKYNIPDVLRCEEVYLKLRPWVAGLPNLVAYTDKENVACPACGGKVVEDGFMYTNVSTYQRYHCVGAKCGAWSRSRYTINTLNKRKSLLTATA